MDFFTGMIAGSVFTIAILYAIGMKMRRSGSQNQKVGVHENVVTRTESFGRDGPVEEQENGSRDESGEAQE